MREQAHRQHRWTSPSPRADADLLALWETAAETCPGSADLARVEAWLNENSDVVPVLLDSLGDPALRDAVLVWAAAGLRTAQADTSELDVAEVDLSVQAPSGDDDAAEASRFLHTLVGHTEAAPHWAQMLRLESLIGVLWAVGDDRAAPDILAMLAWIEWAKGRGSVCAELLDRAVRRVPTHELCRLLHAFVGAGALCPWAQDYEQSWTYYLERVAGVEEPPHPARAQHRALGRGRIRDEKFPARRE